MKAVDDGCGAWIGTNQAPRVEVWGKERGDLIKPVGFGGGFRRPLLGLGSQGQADSSAAKYPVKHIKYAPYVFTQ